MAVGPHHCAAAYLHLRPGFVGQARSHRFQTLAGDGNDVTGLQHGHHLARAGFQHHGRAQVVVVGVLGQGFRHARIHQARVGRQVDEGLGPAVHLTQLELHQAAAQRAVGSHLVSRVDGDVHVQAACVGVVAVLRKHQLAGGLRHELGVHTGLGLGAVAKHLRQGLVVLRFGDEAVLEHAFDDVALALRGAFGVGNRVVGRWRFGQAGQHGCLGHRHHRQRLAEVDLRGRSEAVGALAQENLVHVDLQNLVLAEQALDLQRQQYLVNLAGEGLLGRQVEVARHLHGDGRRALAARVAQVLQRGPHDAFVVDAPVLIEAGVLGRQDSVFHDLRNLRNGREITPLFAEFSKLHAVRRNHPHRQFGPVVGEAADIRQVGECHRQGHGDDQQQQHDRRQPQAQQCRYGARNARGPIRAGATTVGLIGRQGGQGV